MADDNDTRPISDEELARLVAEPTPGPWFGAIKPNGKGPGVVGIKVDSGPGAIAVVNGIPGGPQRVGNTRLIAAAPTIAAELIESPTAAPCARDARPSSTASDCGCGPSTRAWHHWTSDHRT